jgi:poly-gamma-glutamate capsule biosynthesis protein CapA/YwtB (metallophosphatase superfamily)
MPVAGAKARISGDASGGAIKIALCGDVMLGRGIDQVLPHPCDPRLYEGYLTSALDYVALAERANGPIPRGAGFDYVWGDALAALEAEQPDLRIVNLETSITKSGHPAPKGINYRMNPGNVPCLASAKIDCCVLANNHVLDWGRIGLADTLTALQSAGIGTAGAGKDRAQAEAPALFELPDKGRVVVFAFGSESSGIPLDWAAGPHRAGVNVLTDLSSDTATRIAEQAGSMRAGGVHLVASIHWGGNWGYYVPDEQRRFAHDLIDRAGFDIIHGHSSHHPKAVEVHNGKLILYGCGDFLNDYEGIALDLPYRDDLGVAYLARLSAGTGALLGCDLLPFKIRNFRLQRPSHEDVAWLRDTLDRESAGFKTRVLLRGDGRLTLGWT